MLPRQEYLLLFFFTLSVTAQLAKKTKSILPEKQDALLGGLKGGGASSIMQFPLDNYSLFITGITFTGLTPVLALGRASSYVSQKNNMAYK